MSSLTQCLEWYLRPEILNGDNQYFAESENRKVDAIKGLKFGRLPQIMSIQLKRFVYDFSGYDVVQKKLNDVVRFPMVLDMNKYIARKKQSAASSSNTKDIVSEEDDVTGEEFERFVNYFFLCYRDKHNFFCE